MSDERPSLLVRLYRGLDGLRRFTFNLLFLAVLALLVAAAIAGRVKVPDGSALVIDPRGTIVEQLATADTVETLVASGSGASVLAAETLLKDLLDAIRLAKDDARIKAIYLDTSGMTGAGFVKLRALRAATSRRAARR
jgi:protease-4